MTRAWKLRNRAENRRFRPRLRIGEGLEGLVERRRGLGPLCEGGKGRERVRLFVGQCGRREGAGGNLARCWRLARTVIAGRIAKARQELDLLSPAVALLSVQSSRTAGLDIATRSLFLFVLVHPPGHRCCSNEPNSGIALPFLHHPLTF